MYLVHHIEYKEKNPFDKPDAANFFLREMINFFLRKMYSCNISQTFQIFLAPAAPKTFPASYGRLKLFLAPTAPKKFPAAYGRLRFFLAPAAPEIFLADSTPKNWPIFFPDTGNDFYGLATKIIVSGLTTHKMDFRDLHLGKNFQMY